MPIKSLSQDIRVFIITIFAIAVNSVKAQNVTQMTNEPIPDEVIILIDSLEKAFSAIENEQNAKTKNLTLSNFRMLKGFTSTWEIGGQWHSQAPSILSRHNAYGTTPLAKGAAIWHSRWQRPFEVDSLRRWGVGYGFDWQRMTKSIHDKRQVNQAYIDVRYENIVATIGMKQQPEELGNDRLPLVQFHFATDRTLSFSNKMPWLKYKVAGAIGAMTGQSWNITTNELPHRQFHNKIAANALAELQATKSLNTKVLTLYETMQYASSGLDDWAKTMQIASRITLKKGDINASIADIRTFGKISMLWSPIYRLGHNIQSLSVSLPLADISISENRFCKWQFTSSLMPIPNLTLTLNCVYHPELLITGNEILATYTPSDVTLLLADIKYEIPWRLLPGLSVRVSYSTDFIPNVHNANSYFASLCWKRML